MLLVFRNLQKQNPLNSLADRTPLRRQTTRSITVQQEAARPYCQRLLVTRHQNSTQRHQTSMSDHAEEQEMEAEALQAIFDTHFTILELQRWQIAIYPEMTSDIDEHEQLNHVGVHLIAELPSDYPEVLPKLDCQIIKGLVDDHRQELLSLATEEAQANQGVPSIFAIAERLREWLAENNQKGLDDLSMHAQMLRKQQAKEKEVSRRVTVPSDDGTDCAIHKHTHKSL